MRSALFNLLLLGAPLCACTDTATGHVESEIESPNALSLNALSLNALSLNALSLNALSLNGIDFLDQSNESMCATPAGRLVLKYTVGCALPAGTSLSCLAQGSLPAETYQGHIGLAPQWLLPGRLDEVGQRWVSACLLAHVNNFAVPISISLAGPHPALARDDAEQTTYAYKEADFYGNLFPLDQTSPESDGVKSGTIGRVACQNSVTAWPISNWYLRMRICAMPGDDGWTQCHFVDAGNCRPPPPSSPGYLSACLLAVGETDQRCAGGQIYPGWGREEGKDGIDRSTMLNNQTISVYMRQSDAHDLCSQACLVAIAQGWLPPASCADCPMTADDEEGHQHETEPETQAAN